MTRPLADRPDRDDAAEAVLVERARRGDSEALGILLDRCAGLLRARVRAFVSPALRRKLSVADVLQEANLVAVRRLAHFEHRGAGSFARWMARIVENKARAMVRDHLGTAKRAALREVSRGARVDTGQFRARAASPSQMAIAAELEEAVREALADLPEDYRKVLRLLQQEHLTFAQASVRMQRSLPAVRKLYGRALARLAEALDVPPAERGRS
jgi:RNA polymerase sigma-70 factor (ECF subfamily)